MSLKSIGIAKERELIHMFWKTNDWAATRVAAQAIHNIQVQISLQETY